jgi:hypothetical protein
MSHSPLTLTHPMHEYDDDIPWNSVPLRGFDVARRVGDN